MSDDPAMMNEAPRYCVVLTSADGAVRSQSAPIESRQRAEGLMASYRRLGCPMDRVRVEVYEAPEKAIRGHCETCGLGLQGLKRCPACGKAVCGDCFTVDEVACVFCWSQAWQARYGTEPQGEG